MPTSGPSDAPDGGRVRHDDADASPSARARESARGPGEEPSQHLVRDPATDRIGTVEVGHPPDAGTTTHWFQRHLGVVVAHGQALAHLVGEAPRCVERDDLLGVHTTAATEPPERADTVGRGHAVVFAASCRPTVPTATTW